MKIVVIHQAHKVEAFFALLQYECPNLISSMPSVLYALALVANDKHSHKQFGKETCQVEFYMLFYRPKESNCNDQSFLVGFITFSKIFLISLLDTAA